MAPKRASSSAGAAAVAVEAEEVASTGASSVSSAAGAFIPPSQVVRPNKKLLDRNEKQEQKKEVHRRITVEQKYIDSASGRAALIADEDFAYQKSIARAADVHDSVKHTALAVKSNQLVSGLADILHKSVKMQFQSSKTHGIEINQFIAALLQRYSVSGSAAARTKKRRKSVPAAGDDASDEMDAEAAAAHAAAAASANANADDSDADDAAAANADAAPSQRKKRKSGAAANGGLMDEKHSASAAAGSSRDADADAEDELSGEVDWAAVGRATNKYMRTVPTPNFMNGPLLIELKVRSKKASELERSKPSEVETVEDAKASGGDEKSATDQRISRMLAQLVEGEPLNLWQFVTDPDAKTGFTVTVENLFDLSFLIRDGVVSLTIDPTTKAPIIRREKWNVKEAEANSKLGSQFVMNFDERKWKKVVSAYGIARAMLNRDEAEAELVPQSQIFNSASSSSSSAAAAAAAGGASSKPKPKRK